MPRQQDDTRDTCLLVVACKFCECSSYADHAFPSPSVPCKFDSRQIQCSTYVRMQHGLRRGYATLYVDHQSQ
jgi:hypothetical protein